MRQRFWEFSLDTSTNENLNNRRANGMLCSGFITSYFCLFGFQDHPEVSEPPEDNETNEPLDTNEADEPLDTNEANEPLDTTDPPEANEPQESVQ